MSVLIVFFAALALSIALIPPMIRLAPRLGMVDQPDPRKVHAIAIPRAGGIGIVIGALAPVALWLPWDPLIQSYLFGSLVLLGFGMWDDAKELGHYVKFIGQFIAVIAVVYFGDLYVYRFPFAEEGTISESAGQVFTVIALVGMINAANHSDGLDGLAGGLSALSLGAIAYLAHLSDADRSFTIALAALGGILGFLRYNTHPARIFMGDGGSQFLGFTVGFLAVLVTQRPSATVSPAVVLPLLGLPIVDILAVFAQRIYWRINWFRATKNHLHHRLLELGFQHYEAVIVIYGVQMLLVAGGLALRHESDTLVSAFYVAVCGALFAIVYGARAQGYRAHHGRAEPAFARWLEQLRPRADVAAFFVATVISVSVMAFAMRADSIPMDVGLASALLAALMGFFLASSARGNELVARMAIYVTASFAIYVETRFGASLSWWHGGPETAFFAGLAVGLATLVRVAGFNKFDLNPTDILVVFLVFAAGLIAWMQPERLALGAIAAKLAVLFYGCEFVLAAGGRAGALLRGASLAALCVLAVRALW